MTEIKKNEEKKIKKKLWKNWSKKKIIQKKIEAKNDGGIEQNV